MVEETYYWSEIRLRDAVKSLDVLLCSKDTVSPFAVVSCRSQTGENPVLKFRRTEGPAFSTKNMNCSHWTDGCCHL